MAGLKKRTGALAVVASRLSWFGRCLRLIRRVLYIAAGFHIDHLRSFEH
jgi:hypothetical protein